MRTKPAHYWLVPCGERRQGSRLDQIIERADVRCGMWPHATLKVLRGICGTNKVFNKYPKNFQSPVFASIVPTAGPAQW